MLTLVSFLFVSINQRNRKQLQPVYFPTVRALLLIYHNDKTLEEWQFAFFFQFVVPEYAWKTKRKKEKTKTHLNTKLLPIFIGRNNKTDSNEPKSTNAIFPQLWQNLK